MYEVKIKPQIVVEKMKEFRPKIVKKYFAAAGGNGDGGRDPFDNKKFNEFIKNIKNKNITDDIAKKISEVFENKKTSDKMFNNYKINKKAIKFNKFTDVLKKDNIPKDVAEKLNKFLANIKKLKTDLIISIKLTKNKKQGSSVLKNPYLYNKN